MILPIREKNALLFYVCIVLELKLKIFLLNGVPFFQFAIWFGKKESNRKVGVLEFSFSGS